jgi:hypothetical protein
MHKFKYNAFVSFYLTLDLEKKVPKPLVFFFSVGLSSVVAVAAS